MATANRGGVLTTQAVDFPRWYQEVVDKAELADNGAVREPWSYVLTATRSGNLVCRQKWTRVSS